MSQIYLWPPLEVVEAALDGNLAFEQRLNTKQEGGLPDIQGATRTQFHTAHLLLPLTELAKRRSALAAKGFSSAWAPGRLVQIAINSSVMGVLLECQVKDNLWAGWLAASETGWASALDVLLEPDDDPFEPLFGVIQTWNPISLEQSAGIDCQIVGEISAPRLDAIRSVAQECVDGVLLNIPVEPGRIALRMTDNRYMVLTGTPLGVNDPRNEYQNVYRTVAAKFVANQLTQRVSSAQKFHSQMGSDRSKNSSNT